MAAAIHEKEQVPAPDGWTKTFTDPRLCAAIVDRLTFKGAVIETGTDFYRLAHTRAQGEQLGGMSGWRRMSGRFFAGSK